MKNIFIILFCFITFQAISQTWECQRPTPQGKDLRCVYFLDNNHGFSFGDDGAFLEYSNTHWVAKDHITFHPPMHDISFVNPTHGWVVGSDGRILKYNGNRWITQLSFTFKDLNGVSFVDNNNGWAVGDNNTIRRCYYGFWYGEHSPLHDGTDINDVFFVNDEKGWAVGDDGSIIRRTNGEWIKDSVPVTSNLMSVHFTDTANGWAVGEGGVILKANYFNPTAPWVQQYGPMPPYSCTFNSVYFVNPSYGWIVSNNGVVLKYTSGMWHQYQFDNGLNSVYFSDTATGWIVGNGGIIYHYSNGGWIQQSKNAEFPAANYKIDMVDTAFGLAVAGNGGRVLNYNGTEWNVDTSFSASFTNVDCFDRTHAFASGSYWNGTQDISTLFKYDGSRWRSASTTTNMLNDITVIDTNEVWAVGAEGIVGHLMGSTWIEIFPTSKHLQKIQAYNSNFIIAIGDSGALLKYNGLQWNQMDSVPIQDDILSLYIVDTSNVWIGGTEGQLYKWNGHTWENKATKTGQWVNDLFFLDNDFGWAGLCGNLARYNGTSWRLVYTPDDINCFSSIQFTDKKHGWATGWPEHGNTFYIYKVTLNDPPLVVAENISYKDESTVYPNPFTKSTTIEFTIETKQKVDLKIMDASGKTVSTLLSKNLPAGNYKIPFDAKDYKQGIYYYNLKIGSHEEVKKMILVK